MNPAAMPPNSGASIAHRRKVLTVILTGCAVLALCRQAALSQEAQPPGTILDKLAASATQNARAALQQRGIQLKVNYTGEVFAIPSGGIENGTTYDGVLEAVVDVDLEKSSGWKGGSIHANAYQIHGRGPTTFVDNAFTISNIEALQATRLFELWFEQTFFDKNVSVRVGQVAADGDFFASDVSSQFLNGTFGWPGIVAVDLPAGGPAYPLATPGVRLAIAPNKNLTIVTAIFNGSPAAPDAIEPEQDNRHGLDFRLSDPPLMMAEFQYSYSQTVGAQTLPGTLKVGGWYHFGDFADPRSGVLREENHGFHAVVDQLLFALSGSRQKSLSVFFRASASPDNRNLLDFYVDGGFVFSGFVAGRQDDTFGFAVGYGHVASSASAADKDAGLLVVRDFETVFEANYRAEISPGFAIIPDFQYIWHPGTYVSQPNDPTTAVKDAAIIGVRSALKF